MFLRTSSTRRNAFSCLLQQHAGCKGGLCSSPPISSPSTAKGLFPHQAPSPSHNHLSSSRTRRLWRRRSRHQTVPWTVSSWAAAPGPSCTPWPPTTPSSPAGPSSATCATSSTSSPSSTPVSTALRTWGSGELLHWGFFWCPEMLGWSICVSAAPPALGVCRYGTGFFHCCINQIHLHRKQIPLLMLLGYMLPPRPPWGNFGIFWFKLD